uniref:grpE protein homolog 1, mitochondrial n=1 Tax=Myxine glutinosa TaxID=7769 RepID=UPI00358FEA54
MASVSVCMLRAHCNALVRIPRLTLGRFTRMLGTATQTSSTDKLANCDSNVENTASAASPELELKADAGDKALLEEKVKLEEQLKEMTDRYKRTLADMENLRMRAQKMVDEAKLYGIQSFCKDLLEVADILQAATTSVPHEALDSGNPHLKGLHEGLCLTESQLQKVFTKYGLAVLNPLGARFDPYEHEALFHAPAEGREGGTVAVVTKIGYKLHGRTLRPAVVGVVKAP